VEEYRKKNARDFEDFVGKRLKGLKKVSLRGILVGNHLANRK